MVPADDLEPRSPLRALGAFLTGSEADGVAARLASGATLSQALVVVPAPRRPRARELLGAAGVGPQTREHSVAVLNAVAGAASRIKDVTPLWTAPAGAVGGGALTADVFALVGSANTSVVCATYNLQPTSALWAALVDLRMRRPGVSVCASIWTPRPPTGPSTGPKDGENVSGCRTVTGAAAPAWTPVRFPGSCAAPSSCARAPRRTTGAP